MSDRAEATDGELLAAYVGGGSDREPAFHALVDRYDRRVYAICYRYFGNAADAEDAAQETFVSLARRADTFTGDSHLSTWLYRVATNACHDIARRRARRPQTAVAEVPDVPTAADDVSARETEMEVQRALAELDDLSRTLLVLVAIEGLPYAEVSAIVDLPVGTIKSRVHRARARMADLLAAVVDPDAGVVAREPAAAEPQAEGAPRSGRESG